MTGLHTDLNGALERVLAARRDLPVPVGLARRIVVRTVNLPQTYTAASPGAVEPPCSALRRIAPFKRYALPSALAASLACLVFGHVEVGPSAAGPEVAPVGAAAPAQVAALAEDSAPSAAAAVSGRGQPPSSASETGLPVNESSGAVRPIKADDGRTNVQRDTAIATVDSAERASSMPGLSADREYNRFSLADRNPERPRVYGPVLEAEAGSSGAFAPGNASTRAPARAFTSGPAMGAGAL